MISLLLASIHGTAARVWLAIAGGQEGVFAAARGQARLATRRK